MCSINTVNSVETQNICKFHSGDSDSLKNQPRNFSSSMDDAYLALTSLISSRHPDVHRVIDISDIKTKQKHGSLRKLGKGVLGVALASNPVGWLVAICVTGKTFPSLVPEGQIGLSWNNGVPELLPPGWHYLLSPVRKLSSIVSLNQDQISHGPVSIITIKPGYVGYAEDRGVPVVLGPGMHQWSSSTMNFLGSYNISEKLVRMGPYTLITVPEGECAVTSNNGTLTILGADRMQSTSIQSEDYSNSKKSRTYLLDHAKWVFVAWLATTEQFDPLESESLLTNDRVEVNLQSTVAWRIVDAATAAKQGGGMDKIRSLVHREARATVADMILTTKISAGIKGLDSKVKKLSLIQTDNQMDNLGGVENLETGDSGFTKGSIQGTSVDACSKRLERIGVKVDTINIVQLDIVDKTIRDQLAQAAVLSTKIQESSQVARTEAINLRIRAEAEAETIRLKAKADADAVACMAEAKATAMRLHAEAALEAGKMLTGCPLASALEHIRTTGEALQSANSTVFLQPGQDV